MSVQVGPAHVLDGKEGTVAIVPRAQTCWGVAVSVVYSMQLALGGYFTGCHGRHGVASIAPMGWEGVHKCGGR